MSVISRLHSLWRNLMHRESLERDLDDEVDGLFALIIDEQIKAGRSREEAHRHATLTLGRAGAIKEEVRSARAGAFVDVLMQDVRYAARSLRSAPGFSVAAIVTLAVGIGANAAMFTLLDAVILKPLPVPAPDELVTLYENAPKGIADTAGGTGQYLSFSFPRFRRLEQALGSRGTLAAVTRSSRLLGRLPGRLEVSPLQVQLVSGSYFATLGIPAARGRLLGPDDVRAGATYPTAVISDRFWKRAFGASDAAVGQTIVVNDVGVTVIGVAPPGFVGLWTDSGPDLWLPLTLQPALRYESNVSSYAKADRSRPWLDQDSIAWLNVFGRVKSAELSRATSLLKTANHIGIVELADTETDATFRNSLLAHSLEVEPLARGFSGLRGRFSSALFVLMAMVAIVLLVTCANVANLLLTRAAARARDVAVRIALGAPIGRLVRQYLTESVILAAIGGAAGLLLSEWISDRLARQVLGTSADVPPVFTPDSRILMFTAGVTLITAIAFGLAPTFRAIRTARMAGVVNNQRSTSSRWTMKGMRPLVAAQVALSVIIVFAAVLLARTLINYTKLDPGFAVDRLVTLSLDPATSGYSRDQMPALEQRVTMAARTVPGVTSAALSACGLLAGCSITSGFTIEGIEQRIQLHDNWVSPAYFTTVGIPIIIGREFNERDTGRSPRVAIITESIAKGHFEGQNPIGKRLGYVGKLDTEIVGVVRDARSRSVREAPVPTVYFPISQPPFFKIYPAYLDVRVASDAADAAAAVGDAIRRAEPSLLIDSVGPMSLRLARDVARERLVAYLATGFAILALFLAAVGLYAVLSYAVTGRTQEIGVRMALGARSGEVVSLVVCDALRIVVAGMLAGVIAAFGAWRLLKALVFDVSVLDPITYSVVIGSLVVVTLAAAYLPAMRAARVDPILALRAE